MARPVRRPDPGYVDVARLLPVAYVVASVFLVMGVVLIVGDLVAPVRPVSDQREIPVAAGSGGCDARSRSRRVLASSQQSLQ